MLGKGVGPSGNVIVFLDSCFSGTAARGGTAKERGTKKKLGPPRSEIPQVFNEKVFDGFYEGQHSSTKAKMKRPAPYVVFSATTHDQLAKETWMQIEEGNKPKRIKVGSLTYGLSQALLNLGANTTTYYDLYEKVKGLMAKKVSNVPQIEGDKHSEIFDGGAVKQENIYRVLSVEKNKNQVIIKWRDRAFS